ncbi:MAG TPA: hypothetical protein VM118_09305, partial [Acidobacteriota bacterium]|nr:hypothetical protein [Acidobacteriota bacterium]
ITVSPSAPGDLYCGDSDTRLTFNVPTVKYWGLDENLDCVLLQSSSKSYPMQYTIKQIADKWGGGEYLFEIGSAVTACGCTSLEKKVKIVVVRFDDVTEPLTICKDQVRPLAVTVTPADAPVTWLSGDTDVLTLSSATAPFSIQGSKGGLSTVQPMLNGVACCEAKAVQVVEIELTDCPAAWLPEGRQFGTATGDPGNSVQFTATIKNGAMAKIRFWLLGTSSEPGVCINYGDETAKDLKFIQSATVNPPELYDAPMGNGVIIQTKEEVNAATVTVTCYDWGAWGGIQACALDDKGQECGCTDTKKMPIDDLPAGGNHVADAWQPANASKPTTWDGDKEPENMKCDGDGFTYYEEYRGTMTGFVCNHTRLDPDRKDLFLYDENLLHLMGPLYNNFLLITDFEMHYLNADPAKLMNGTGLAAAGHRVVNHKSSAAVKLHNQFALHIRERDLGGRGSWGLVNGALLGPPETADPDVNIDKAQIEADLADCVRDQGGDPTGAEQAAYANVSSLVVGQVTSHEMGHGVNVLEPSIHHRTANGGRASAYGNNYSGEAACVMRYSFDLIDAADATHTKMCGIRTLALSPLGTTLPARFEFSNYTNKDLSDLTPVANIFCTSDNKCRKSLDVKDK